MHRTYQCQVLQLSSVFFQYSDLRVLRISRRWILCGGGAGQSFLNNISFSNSSNGNHSRNFLFLVIPSIQSFAWLDVHDSLSPLSIYTNLLTNTQPPHEKTQIHSQQGRAEGTLCTFRAYQRVTKRPW